MLRGAYLSTLWLLEAALLSEALPAFVVELQRTMPLGGLTGGPGLAALACALASVAGITITLGYPTLAWMRHAQRGPHRFAGLPRWAVFTALCGAALFVAGWALDARMLRGLAELAPGSSRAVAVAGVSLMGAGTLAAELLRRSLAPKLARERVPQSERHGAAVAPALRREPSLTRRAQP